MARLTDDWSRAPRRIPAVTADTRFGERRVLLALPNTFMNESGRPVAALAKYYSVPADDIVLVHDDIDLPFGRMRFHFGRGPGGHNGVASVLQALGGVDLWRLRVGVGRPPGRMDPADFVLRRFAKEERPEVDLMVIEAADVLAGFAASGEDEAKRIAGEGNRRREDGPL